MLSLLNTNINFDATSKIIQNKKENIVNAYVWFILSFRIMGYFIARTKERK